MRDEALAMLAAGQLTAEEIAAELGISRRTVFRIAARKKAEIDAAVARNGAARSTSAHASLPEPSPEAIVESEVGCDAAEGNSVLPAALRPDHV